MPLAASRPNLSRATLPDYRRRTTTRKSVIVRSPPDAVRTQWSAVRTPRRELDAAHSTGSGEWSHRPEPTDDAAFHNLVEVGRPAKPRLRRSSTPCPMHGFAIASPCFSARGNYRLGALEALTAAPQRVRGLIGAGRFILPVAEARALPGAKSGANVVGSRPALTSLDKQKQPTGKGFVTS